VAGANRTEWLDAQDRIVAVAEPGGYVTRYALGPLGNRRAVSVNDSLFLTNTFDGQGRRIRSVYRHAGTWTSLCDAAGNLVQRTDGKGDVVTRNYDDVNRVTEVRHGATVQESYVYDTGDPGEENTAGNLVSVSGPFGAVRFRYGKCGCYMSKTRTYPGLAGDLTAVYSTDSLRRYTTVTYPDGFEQEITYNAGGLIESITGVIDKVSYGPTGKRTPIEFSSGVVTDYEYDPASLRLTRLKTKAPDGATTYQDLSYEFDEVGAVTAITDAANAAGHIQSNRSFTYDALEQLLRSTGTDANGAFDHEYEYDSWGNITRYPEQFQDDRLLCENAGTRFRVTGIENLATNPYVYDATGNLTSSLHHSYEYDARNRLVKTTRDDGTVFEYSYDHQGSRVMTTVTAAGVTESLFNFDDIYTVANGAATKFVFDDGGQVALLRADDTGVVFTPTIWAAR
jgi:YD repeat-containing protein